MQARAGGVRRAHFPQNGTVQCARLCRLYPSARFIVRKPITCMAALVWCASALSGASGRAMAAPCLFEEIGEGRVVEVVDGRGFRLDDGRKIRLAGIEADGVDRAALTTQLSGRDVMLRATDDAPDRYGRQVAFALLVDSEVPVQSLLHAQGEALVLAENLERECAAALATAEAEARRGHKIRVSGTTQMS
jgi:endonuclease YncB( thermonuclease family)